MYDFWFTLGRATMRPGLLEEISKVAFFQRLGRREFKEFDSEGNETASFSNTESAGLLSNGPTTAVRQAIRKYYLTCGPAGAPPVSLFTAGRLTQLIMVPEIAFVDNIKIANEAYQAALGPSLENVSNGFIAFLGLCVIDLALTAEFQDPKNPDLLDTIEEFGIDPDFNGPELQVIQRYVGNERFKTAQGNLLNGAGWPRSCGEQIRFWDEMNERTVLN